MEWINKNNVWVSNGINGKYKITKEKNIIVPFVGSMAEGYKYTTPNEFGNVSGTCRNLEDAIKNCEESENIAIESEKEVAEEITDDCNTIEEFEDAEEFTDDEIITLIDAIDKENERCMSRLI